MNFATAPNKGRIYTVSELTASIKGLLEQTYSMVCVCGEISNFRKPVSGHFYFTLKDPDAQLSSVMFRGQNRCLKFEPEDGMAVIAMGRLNIYEQRGTYQIVIEHLEPKGLGQIQLAFEQLKTKLASEGLFDSIHKKQLPLLPGKITIITSPTGAVIRDILHVSSRRFANMPVEIVPVKVQGNGAAEEIVDAFALVNKRSDSDAVDEVIILARGGGSLEDLQPFNLESVARAIFESRIPVISAIGHETDFTIADLVADLRSPTPSAAAEMAIPVKTELIARIQRSERRLFANVEAHINYLKEKVKSLSRRLIHPQKRLEDCWLRLDDMLARMVRGHSTLLRDQRHRIDLIQEQLAQVNPLLRVRELKLKLSHCDETLRSSIDFFLHNKNTALQMAIAKLNALSPLATLERGYSVTRTLSPERLIVKAVDQVTVGQAIEVTVAKGGMICRVERKMADG